MAGAEVVPHKPTTTTITAAGASSQAPIIGQPQGQLEVEDNAQGSDGTEWPTGATLWLNLSSILLCAFLRGLDLTIVAAAVPSLTNDFKTVSDIGWYSAAYGLTASATIFFSGKAYTLFDTKKMYLSSIVIFWIGSSVCTFAPSSKVFVFGRAIAGLGSAWQAGGLLTQFNAMFPMHKRPFWLGLIQFVQTVAMVTAPILGGALIQRFSWRACFGINIPLNVVAFVFSAYSMKSPDDMPDVDLPLKEKLKRLDIVGSMISIPGLVCLLMALQWGGIRYGWRDWRIIVLFVVSGTLLATFAFIQHRLQDNATIPPRIAKKRSILAGAWFSACCDGTLAITETYLAIYFQGVRGLSPAYSGVLGVPMIVGLAVANLAAGIGTTKLGYYTPFMLFTSAVSPIASGLLTTLDLDSQVGKAAGLLGLLGFALGMGMSGPIMAVNTTLKPSEMSIGTAITGFGAGMGSAMGISAAALLFQNRLADEISLSAPGTNITAVEKAGLSEIRNTIGPERLKHVLVGYDKAVAQTLYLPLALTVATVVGSSLTEWNSVKKKEE